MPILPRSIDLKPLDESLVAQGVQELAVYCKSYDLDLSDTQFDLCVRHLLYVLQVNEYINLTSITDVHKAIVLHVLDSLHLLPYLSMQSRSLLDMGTGAGYPGIPLAIASGIDCYLLDSVGKKINADNAIIDALGLDNVRGYHARVETCAIDKRGCFDVVVARALAPLPVLLEYARPFLSKNGLFIVAKGIPEDDELASGERVASCLGFKLEASDSLQLPDDLGSRSILVYKAVRPSSVRLPRAVGMARKQPLA